MSVLSPQGEAFLRQLKARLPTAQDVDDAARLVRTDLEPLLGGFSPQQEEDLREAAEELRRSLGPVEILRINSMFRTHRPWYAGPREQDSHWPALKTYLIDSKGLAEETVEGSINSSSTEIVSLLGNPASETFAYRGLVIGHVQSGKTANMTAVIAKAVDAGYNLVIILAGITNKLRRQTQGRMEKDLTNRLRDRWVLQTTPDDHGDFRMPANGGFQMPAEGVVQMAVVKKNVAPLGQLLQTIRRTLPPILRRLRVLIIDDEADQASINTASGEFNMTRINERIREILKELPANSYVGYTATPFANVLINPYADGGRDLDDLYPRDFITALPTPDGYFGTERLFGRDPIDAATPLPEEDGLDVIRSISDEDAAKLQPRRRADKDHFQAELPESLIDAIIYFIATCAARRYRGQSGEHMSMLVHTSPFVVMHEKTATLIGAWLDVNRGQLASRTSELQQRMRRQWDEEQSRVPDTLCPLPAVDFEQLQSFIPEVLEALEVPVENGTSEDRIDYEGPPKTYIVVGGSILARGLTIEGLTVSYFLRTSGQYDTLLQMGRWFGYRQGYEDLPRIWMTDGLATSFRALASIEAEIRQDVAEYARRQVTPMEFAVRVRAIPGMAITAASKMRAASVVDVSYSGKHVQTIRFDHRDAAVVRGNWSAGGALLAQAEQLGLRSERGEGVLYEKVPRRLIVQFLRAYSVQRNHRELSAELLLGYIEQGGRQLEEWNVGVVQSARSTPSEVRLGPLEELQLLTRTRLEHPVEFADIKALMSRKDVLFDCDAVIRTGVPATESWESLKEIRTSSVGDVPLLLLYPIDKASSPAREGGARVSLDAIDHVLGCGIVFPGSAEGAGGYYSVTLQGASADELDDVDREIEEQLEAGRVL